MSENNGYKIWDKWYNLGEYWFMMMVELEHLNYNNIFGINKMYIIFLENKTEQ